MKTNKSHFALFRKECLMLQKKWHLNWWSIYFKHWEKKSEASVAVDWANHSATIFLWTNISQDLVVTWLSTNQYIKQLAKHEMIHVLLGWLVTLWEARYTSAAEMVSAEEELVRKLITLL